MLYDNIMDLVGNTPLLKLNHITAGLDVEIYAKMEMLNPTGSVKDRAAREMILDAKKKGLLRAGSTLVENSSGNLAVAIAAMANALCYRSTFVVHNGMSPEKLGMLKLLGANIIVGDATLAVDHPESPQSILKRTIERTPDGVHLNQYFNQMNPLAHYRTTGKELFEQTGEELTHLVCTIGTGGTISGAGRFLKEKDPEVKVIGIDPEGSMVSNYVRGEVLKPGKPSYIEAIGRWDFIPTTLWRDFVDDVITIGDAEAMAIARQLAIDEGIMAGWSSGAAVAGALKVARSIQPGGRIVVVLPDGGNRYTTKFVNWRYSATIGILNGLLNLTDLIKAKGTDNGLITVQSWNTIGYALGVSIKRGVRHIPVIKDQKIIGKVEREKLVSIVTENPLYYDMPLNFFAEEPYPEVDLKASLESITKIIQEHGCVIIYREDKPFSILTKSDLANLNYWPQQRG